MRRIERLLVANRGEIARRVIRTAKRLGIHTIAVHSDIDENAPFAKEANEKHLIGSAAPKESYLNRARILEVAKAARADAIHPGYGFLSEDGEFAEAVEAEGMLFVGPPKKAMEALGDKLGSRALAEAAGIPLIPGSGALGPADDVAQAAQELGYPVLVKASAGGGGIGLVRVESEKRLERAVEDSKKKGKMFFGDDTVYLEKAIEHAAHVEVQILADQHGEVVALGERDCTIQRRNQKLIEETPSPRISDSMRERMFEAAVSLANRAGYVNAGTVELLFDVERESFHFLEVNSRLQVEHPITELVLGLDLVELQLRIAEGQRLSELIGSRTPRGHAIELRICAEDPEKRFFPSPGQITSLEIPKDIRVDSGIERGSVVPPAYDSLLLKVAVHAEDRAGAIAKARSALEATKIDGIKTNIAALGQVLASDLFASGRHETDALAHLGFKW